MSSVEQLGAVGDALLLDLGPKLVEQLGGRLDADVGADQRLLELVPGLLVDLLAGQDRADVAAEQGAGLAEPVAEPGLDRHLGSLDGWWRQRFLDGGGQGLVDLDAGLGGGLLGVDLGLELGLVPGDVVLDRLGHPRRARRRLEQGGVTLLAGPDQGEAGAEEDPEHGHEDEGDDDGHDRRSLVRGRGSPAGSPVGSRSGSDGERWTRSGRTPCWVGMRPLRLGGAGSGWEVPRGEDRLRPRLPGRVGLVR